VQHWLRRKCAAFDRLEGACEPQGAATRAIFCLAKQHHFLKPSHPQPAEVTAHGNKLNFFQQIGKLQRNELPQFLAIFSHGF